MNAVLLLCAGHRGGDELGRRRALIIANSVGKVKVKDTSLEAGEVGALGGGGAQELLALRAEEAVGPLVVAGRPRPLPPLLLSRRC